MNFASIPHAFAAASADNALRPAIICGSSTTTYAELASRAEAISQWLRERNIGPGSHVGLYAQRSADAIAAILGILQVGAAYVPFDTSYPTRLLRHTYEDSQPAAMIIQAALVESGNTEPFWHCEVLRLEAIRQSSDRSSYALAAEIGPETPAYIMYTSGSTGRPKGVVVPHRAILRLVLENDFAAMGPGEVILHLAPLSFDASTFEIWGALLNGGCLAVIPQPYPSLAEIADAITRYRVTTLWLTAGLFHLMVDNQLDGLRPLKQLLAGGDVLSPPHVLRVLCNLPDCRLINGYGPTENTTFSCCYTVPHDYDGSTALPIGRAIRNTETLVLDESMNRVPDGEEGELYVGGLGLALGYLNLPDLTRERFVPHPFDPRARLYRTGDRVKRRKDGNHEFLGRTDRQVKINGKRVELDAIEACLRDSGLVQDAAVICHTSSNGQKQVLAFVTALPGQCTDTDALRARLKDELPDYMVPAQLKTLEKLPLGPTGKVDRSGLQPDAISHAKHDAMPATSASESALLAIWCRVLGRDSIGVEDNFFDLGGTSLQLLAVHAEISRTLAAEVSVVEMFQFPKVGALAHHMDRRTTTPATSSDARTRALRQQGALAARRRPQNGRNEG